MKLMRFLAGLFTAALLAMLLTNTAQAQGYGNDPPQRLEVGRGEVDFDGTFRTRYTAPEDIDAPYLVYVVGTDEDGEPFEWISAQVTPAFEGLSWSLQGRDMLPGSTYILEARYAPGTALTPDEIKAAEANAAEETEADVESAVETGGDGDDSAAASDGDSEDATKVLGSQQTPDGGSNSRALVGSGIVAAVVGGAALYGMRMRRRHA